MKKTATLLLAMSSLLSLSGAATTFTYETTHSGNSKAQVHGFYLSLTSSLLQPSNGSTAFSSTGHVQLNQLTITGRNDNLGANAYGLLVLNENDNTVVGKSTSVQQAGANANLTFEFVATDASSLILDASSTYRFLMVSEATMDLVETSSSITYQYAAGGTGAPSINESHVISGGLVVVGAKVQTGVSRDADCNFITSSSGSGTTAYAPVLTNIQFVQIPEPATASLSLMGLAALLMRRKRA